MLRTVSVAALVVLGLTVGSAQASTRTSGNACKYSYNNEFRPQQVTLGGRGSPVGATPGSVVTLSGASLSATLPPSLPQAGYDLGIFKKGTNKIPARVWVALQASNTTEPTKVVALTYEASTRITTNADGSFKAGTPINVTIPIPNQTWTVAGPGGVAFTQAPAGTLPQLPVGVGDRNVAVGGSIVVAPRLGNLRFVLDCEPGSTSPPYQSRVPAVPKAFASLDAAAPVAAITPGGAKASIASTKLGHRNGRTTVSVKCTDGPLSCTGDLKLRTAAGKTAAATKAYRVPPNASRNVSLTLSKAAKSTLKRRSSMSVRATIEPANGAAPVTRKLTLSKAKSATATAAAAKRVVALEWDSIENLKALGIKPVGGADLRGYKQYVAGGLPGGIQDVGTRQEPSLERIAKLKPDLIIVPGYRAGRNLKTLRKISKVLVTNPYPGGSGDTHYNAMIRDFRKTASAVGKPAKGRQVLARMNRTFSRLKARLRAKKRTGIRITIATPGGSSGSPAARLFTSNSAASTIVRKLGMRNSWTASPARYGFSTVGVEALRRVQSGWLAFVYPRQFRSQILRFTRQSAYQRLAMVKKKRVRHLGGNTWLFGGPISSIVFAERLTTRLTQ